MGRPGVAPPLDSYLNRPKARHVAFQLEKMMPITGQQLLRIVPKARLAAGIFLVRPASPGMPMEAVEISNVAPCGFIYRTPGPAETGCGSR